MKNLVFCLLLLLPPWAYSLEPIRIQSAVEPRSLDPALVSDLPELSLVSNLYEGLVDALDDGSIEPAQAESYTVSKDGLTYRFKIRSDRKWSDGKPVTAEQFRLGLLRTLNPTTASASAGLLFSIRGAKDFFFGKIKAGSIEVRAVKNELTIRLEKPDDCFLKKLALPIAAPWRSDFSSRWNSSLPTNGYYFVKSSHSGQDFEFAPNPYHQIEGQLSILFRLVPDTTAAMNLFETGKLDILTSVGRSDFAAFKDKGMLVQAPSPTVVLLRLNRNKPPLQDLKWRKAIAGAIDRSGLLQLTEPLMTKAESNAIRSEKEIREIRELALHPSIELQYAFSNLTDLIVQKIQSDLSKKLGLKVILRGMDWKSFTQVNGEAASALRLETNGALYDDPIEYLKIYHSPPRPVSRDVEVVPLLRKVQTVAVSKHIQNAELRLFRGLPLHRLRRVAESH